MARLKVTRTGGDGAPPQPGEEVLVDGNLRASFVRATLAAGGDDETGDWWHGRVEVRWSWGVTEEIEDVRAGLFVDEV
ncbi:hypothetical protein G6541_08320 [Streptomyces albidoflavus]|nr:hypothetical protein [Streptomyces albidoflavus]